MVWGCSSAGEHFVDIEGVTGSIPVTPTIFQITSNIYTVLERLFSPSVTCLAMTSKGQCYGFAVGIDADTRVTELSDAGLKTRLGLSGGCDFQFR